MAAALLVPGLGDLAGDDQFTVLELDVYLVLAYTGRIDLDHVGLVGLGQVGERHPGPAVPLKRGQAEGEVHQLTHAVVDVLELAGRIDDCKVPSSAATDREHCHG